MINKKQMFKLLILLTFVAGFVFTGLYCYNYLVKKNSFKPEQFKNGK